MKYMICSRFHSMVLSSIFNQKLFVVSYSLKIDNVIDDLKLTKSRIRLESVAEDFKLPLTKFTKVNKIKLFMLYIKAKKQLKVFDKIIKNKKTI